MQRSSALIPALCCLSLVSCKKPVDRTLNVEVRHAHSGNAVQGSEVQLDAIEVTPQVITNNYTSLGTASTSSDGMARITYENARFSSFRITSSKTGFFTQEDIVNPDLIAEDYVHQVELTPSGWIHYSVKNVAPSNAADEYRLLVYSDGFNTSCPNNCDLPFLGSAVDTSFSHQVEALIYTRYLKVNVTLGTSQLDSTLVPQGDTAFVVINY